MQLRALLHREKSFSNCVLLWWRTVITVQPTVWPATVKATWVSSTGNVLWWMWIWWRVNRTFFSLFNHSLHSNIGMDSSSSGGENVKILYIIFPQHFPLYSTNRIYFKLHSENFCCFNSGIVFVLLLCNADGGILYCIDEIVECKIWDAHLLDCWSFIMEQELSTFIHSFFFCQTSKCSWSS